MTGEQTRPLNSYAIGAFVYAEQDGKLLRLKRAGGAHTGAWSLPGGAKEHGESPEEAAVRELMEETRLAPSSALELIGVAPVQVYGMDWVHCFYACDSVAGQVVLNDEHDAHMWVEPVEYGALTYTDEVADLVRQAAPNAIETWETMRGMYGRYLAWRSHRQECTARR